MAERAAYRCEYCLIHEDDAGFSHEVDHIVSRKHGGTSSEDNLAYACVVCNRNKGSDIASTHPESGKILRLYHPRRDRWSDHFRLNGGLIEPLTDLGAVTLRLLRLNAPERIVERKILQLLRSYPVR